MEEPGSQKEICVIKYRGLISLKDFSQDEINEILDRADYWSQDAHFRISNNIRVLDNPIVCNLFFESSTRTRFSFEVAAKKLGFHLLNFEPNTSSTQKGETVYDTLRTLEAMGVNIAVIRTKEENLLNNFAPQFSMAFINAGAGISEHPSQGLLDLLTIRQHFGRIDGLKVAIIGDIEYSRVAKSNIIALSKFNAQVLLAGPSNLMPKSSELYPEAKICDIDEAIKEADIVMMLRVQRERHPRKADFDWDTEQGRKKYFLENGLTRSRFNRMQKHAVIMHPAPFNRGIEIDGDLVEDPKSLIFKQVRNGVAVRMALLERACN